MISLGVKSAKMNCHFGNFASNVARDCELSFKVILVSLVVQCNFAS